ncbi:MAG: 4-(cytidine 5'-diphospho)-2-C-methyl-D-erythritol kinase [Ilumatobacteraceae bacterium]|jgi:4-diphosphocytidyl-2-C-methyl-D-erythritol kinase
MIAHSGVTHVRAPAKLTLSLRVTAVRADGFHEIDAEMVTLDFGDELRIDPAGDSLTVDGPFATGIGNDDSNLVSRALRLAGRRAGVHLTKNVPHGAGLGGGSADAAAVLRWAGYDDLAGASRLGADVPFCMVGGRARVTGIGEIITPLEFVPLDVTLVVPPLVVSTPAVYRAWDSLPTGSRSGERNDLEAAACAVEPRLTAWKARITAECGATPTLAGSGSTWFVDGKHPHLAAALPEATVVVASTQR